MVTITLQEAQATLTDLIHRLPAGEELLITENERPVAKLVMTPKAPPSKRRFPVRQRKHFRQHPGLRFAAPSA